MAKNAKQKKLILVTNDDGITAPGIRVLAKHMRALGDVYVVAPDREQSAVGHSLTLRDPLRVTEIAPKTIAVDGTPTDAVLLAYYRLLPARPDLVVSGINYGWNLGDDATYSGTVSAAFEAMLLGIPAIAISTGRDKKKVYYDVAARFALKIGREVLKKALPRDTLLNVNLPSLPESRIKGVTVTRQGRRMYDDVIFEKTDPRGRPYYWIGDGNARWLESEGTDVEAIQSGRISITPIHRDLTNHSAIDEIKGWKVKK